jgi:DNA polymerase-1
MLIKGKLFDTMIAHYLINPDMRHNMDILETYLKYSPQSIEALIGKRKKPKSMRDVELEEIKEYAVEDADVTLQLKEITLELDKRNQETFEEMKFRW